MDIKRYILTQGILLDDKTIIPIWDSRIEFEKTDMYGNVITFDGSYKTYHSLIECIFDLKTKTISPGIDLDIYPNKENLKHKINDIVLFEDRQKHTLTKIVDIIFEEYDLQIQKGKKIDNWHLQNIPKDIIIEKDSLYALKLWKPTFVLDNGQKTIWGMYLRNIENLDYLQK
jgi:hypothetical protein